MDRLTGKQPSSESVGVMLAVPCPSCGDDAAARLDLAMSLPFAASTACYAAYLDLSAYNVDRAHVDFLHQVAVDAYAAAHPGPPAKNITFWFALVGLHLAVDHHRTGRQVQQAHQRLAGQRREWQGPPALQQLAGITAASVLARPAGKLRDEAISAWATEVWAQWRFLHANVADLAAEARLY